MPSFFIIFAHETPSVSPTFPVENSNHSLEDSEGLDAFALTQPLVTLISFRNFANMDQVITDIRNGNISAFKRLFEDYYPILCVYAQHYIADPEPCKDIAQEVLLTCWERRTDFNELQRLKSFLYTATKNRCLNMLKHDAYIDGNYDQTIHTNDYEIEDEIIRQETFLLVRKAVADLPTQMQRIIRLSLQGKRNQEIARMLGISEGTVHSLKKTAYKKLRTALKEHFILLLLFGLDK